MPSTSDAPLADDDPDAVADILGHKTLAMTMEVYSHTLLPERASAMRQAFPSQKAAIQSQAG